MTGSHIDDQANYTVSEMVDPEAPGRPMYNRNYYADPEKAAAAILGVIERPSEEPILDTQVILQNLQAVTVGIAMRQKEPSVPYPIFDVLGLVVGTRKHLEDRFALNAETIAELNQILKPFDVALTPIANNTYGIHVTAKLPKTGEIKTFRYGS